MAIDKYHRDFPLALPNGHLNRSDYHMPILSVMHRPANDQLAEQVENHAEKELSFLRRDLCYIRHPFGVWLQSGEIPFQMIPDSRWSIRLTSQASALLAWPPLNAVFGHQSRDAVQAG